MRNRCLKLLEIPAIFILILSLSLNGCVRFKPHPDAQESFMTRAETKEQNGVAVSVAVLSNKESKKVFGVNLAGRGIQPIWVKIENKDDDHYLFLQRSVDPNYFSPQEAAYVSRHNTAKRMLVLGVAALFIWPLVVILPIQFFSSQIANKKIMKYFQETGIRNAMVMPGETKAGYVFVPIDEGTKKIHLELFGDEQTLQFSFLVEVPGLHLDYARRDFGTLYPQDQIKEYNENELQKMLEELPCCTTSKKGNKNNDPLNLVVISDFEDLISSFTSAKWDQTEATDFKTSMRMTKAFLLGKNYRYSPMSPLYFEGRSQDMGFQKARSTINERLHLRLWYTPIRYAGKPVWIGTVSRDIGVKFTFKSWYLMTHKIDGDIDDSRDYVLADLADIQRVEQYGFVKGSVWASNDKPAKNLMGDKYYSDGLRVVIDLSEAPAKLGYFDWEYPTFNPATS